MVSLTIPKQQEENNIETVYDNSNTLVQKYGGTSVGTSEAMLNVSNIIKNSLKTSKVVAVLSAMSSQKKSEGTTSKLIKAMENICNPEYVLEITNEIKDHHIRVAKEAITNEDILIEIIENIDNEFSSLNTFLKALSVVGEISSKSKDYIVSVGEKLSANLLSGILRSQGIDSCYVNLEHAIEYSDLNHFKTTLNDKFFKTISDKFATLIQNCLNQNKVPVVTGFFGVIPGSLLSTIGRGYTDLCAALIAVGIKAKELQIWKEVDGIYTADPRKTPKAKLLKQLTASEAEELTYFGSEVIHPYVMKQAVLSGIPVKIKCVFNPEDAGTLIVLNDKAKSNYRKSKLFLENEPTAVTIKDNTTLIHIHLNSKSGDNNSYNTFYSILKLLDDCGISADLVTISQNKIIMAITESGKKLERFILKVKESQDADVKRGMCIVALITPPIIDKMLLTSKMLKVLSNNNIEVEMISQGASNNNIALVVSNDKAIKSMQLIHDECIVASNLISDSPNNDINEKHFKLFEEMSSSSENYSSDNFNENNSPKLINNSISIKSDDKQEKNKPKMNKLVSKTSSFTKLFFFKKRSNSRKL